MANTPRIAVIGATDSATELASKLAAVGAQVVPTLAEADVVFAASTSMLALKTARDALAELPRAAVYADLTPGTPSLKRNLAEALPAGSFADVTLVATGQGKSSELALAASGPGAARLAELLAPFIAVEVISDVPGAAAARALLQSMLSNGIASVLADTLWAAESVGQATWLHQEILRQCDAGTAESVQALLADTATNFKRRQIDMQDVVELLSESGYESTMLAPIQFTHGRIMHSKKIPHAKG